MGHPKFKLIGLRAISIYQNSYPMYLFNISSVQFFTAISCSVSCFFSITSRISVLIIFIHRKTVAIEIEKKEKKE